jgi:hypothetical protein
VHFCDPSDTKLQENCVSSPRVSRSNPTLSRPRWSVTSEVCGACHKTTGTPQRCNIFAVNVENPNLIHILKISACVAFHASAPCCIEILTDRDFGEIAG